MPAPAIIAGVVTTLLSGVKDYFTRKQEIKHAEHEAQLKRITENEQSASRLDELSIASRSWKDEYLLLLVTFPIIVIFSGVLTGNEDWVRLIGEAFTQLKETTPEYYWWALGLVYIDTFGFRRMFRVAVEQYLVKRFGGK